MRAIVAGVLAALLSLGASAQATDVAWEALPSLVAKAPATLADQLNARAAMVHQGYLARAWAPKIGVGAAGVAGSATVDGSPTLLAAPPGPWAELSAEAALNLWRGGQDRHRNEAVDAEADLGAQEASRDQLQRLTEARKAWLDAWVEGQRLSILDKVGEQVKEDRLRAQKKADAGLTVQSDVTEFELRLQALGLEIAQAQDRKDIALSRLAALLGLADGEVGLGGELTGSPAMPQGIDEGHGADELILLLQSKARVADAGGQGTWPYPSLDAGFKGLLGGPSADLNGPADFQARLGLTVALSGASELGVEKEHLIYQSKALLALGEREDQARRINSKLLTKRIARWNAILNPLEDRLKMASDFRERVSKEYARGVKDARDLESATGTVAEAATALVEARSSAWDAWSELERLKPIEGARP